MSRINHREVLYETYVSRFKGKNRPSAAATQWLWRLRGWLPEKTAPLLEVGCGQGQLLAALRAAGYHDTLGVDATSEQIDGAVPGAGPIICVDAQTFLEHEGRVFDTVIAIDFLEHLSKEEAIDFLRLVHTTTSRQLILQVPNVAAPRGMYHQSGDLTHQTMFSPSSLRQLLLACNFSEPEFREVVPFPRGVKGRVRSVLWRGLRMVYQVADAIELGGVSCLYSRNMLVRAPV
jgi:SAM-dependent methyltransferase